MKNFLLSIGLAFLLIGCAGEAGPAGLSKDEARKIGKADWPEDHCGSSEWYDDGECDDFCPSPDPDCHEGAGGCGDDDSCRYGEVCDIHACEENASGRCADRDDCNPGSGPVCGCDGTTYDNDCERLEAEVAARHLGDCRPESCGGFRGQSCPTGKVCSLESCSPEATGLCQPLPTTCQDVGQAVCGCDGQTYRNDCLRLLAGVARSSGSCPY